MHILESAAKMVFLLLTVTACAGFLLDKLPVDQFMLLSVSAFSFYFSNKGSTGDEGKPFLGK
jgi:hypothetical protein